MSTLVLLVGMNPLPIWVVFDAINQPDAPTDLRPDRVLLLFSKATEGTAVRLRDRMKKTVHTVMGPSLDPRDSMSIRRDIDKTLHAMPADALIHVNYTGGTKEMAVSAYAATTAYVAKKSDVSAVFSYLDPDSFRLRVNDRQTYPHGSRDLRSTVRLPLNDLLALHNWERAPEQSVSPFVQSWSKTTQAIWETVGNNEMAMSSFQQWVKAVFSKPDGTRRGTPSLREETLFIYPTDPHLTRVLNAMCSETPLPSSPTSLTWSQFFERFGSRNSDSRSSLWKEFAGYFHGKWMEYWLHSQIERLAPSGDISDLAQNVEVVPNGGGTKVELDVVMTRGYQFYLFSCSTAVNRSHLKNKGFEALRRSQQFGGDEAQAVLVTLRPYQAQGDDASVKNLRQDLSLSGEPDRRLRVWGIDELRNLDQVWRDMWEDGGAQ